MKLNWHISFFNFCECHPRTYCSPCEVVMSKRTFDNMQVSLRHFLWQQLSLMIVTQHQMGEKLTSLCRSFRFSSVTSNSETLIMHFNMIEIDNKMMGSFFFLLSIILGCNFSFFPSWIGLINQYRHVPCVCDELSFGAGHASEHSEKENDSIK